MSGVLLGILIIALGLFAFFKPDIIWKMRYSFSVKNGEPTEGFLTMMKFTGVCIVILGVIFMFSGIG